MLDSIGEKAFLTHNPHIGQRTSDTARQKILAQARQRGSIRAPKHVRRDREIELVDQVLLEKRAEERRAPFASYRSDLIFAAQLFKHPSEIH